MTLTTHTVTLETAFPGGAALDGNWTLSVVAEPPILMDTAGDIVFAGEAVRSTTAGRLVLTLPETGQAGLDPPEALWRLRFESKDHSTKLGPFVFDLLEDKTLAGDLAESTGFPITLTYVSQVQALRDQTIAARDQAIAAAAGAGTGVTTVNGQGPGVVTLSAADVGATPALASASAVATARTLALTDAGKVLETTSATGLTLTVPTNAAVAFPVGTLIEVYQSAAGQVTIAGSVGVTLRSRGGALKTAGQYATVGLRKRATDEWVAAGDLTT